MFLESFEDSTVIVLMVSAVVSLVVGLYESLATGWIEGSAILAAVIIVAVVTATNNYMKEQQFQKLNDVKDDISIPVIRNGEVHNISVKELVVGDMVRLNAGDKVPADGLMVDGSDVSCNESALTGENDDKTKTNILQTSSDDPFLLSGTTLSSGFCIMLVTAIGKSSRWGKIRATLTTESPDTPLQEKLSVLADQIGYIGMGCAAATALGMIGVYYFYPERRDPDTNAFEAVLKAFIMAVTIVVVAVPEGLPLAVTLSLAFSTQKMMNDNNLIRVLSACETMGNATNICSDKTGTLTQNKMTVVECYLGGKHHKMAPNSNEIKNKEIIRLVCQGIAVNTTASLVVNDKKAIDEYSVLGNKTEGALLIYMANKLNTKYHELRSEGFKSSRGDKMLTFSSARKCMRDRKSVV